MSNILLGFENGCAICGWKGSKGQPLFYSSMNDKVMCDKIDPCRKREARNAAKARKVAAKITK